MPKNKSYTFTLNEKALYEQSGTVTVDAGNLQEAINKALTYSQEEHHGDNEIDYNSEKTFSRSIKALNHIAGLTLHESLNDEALLNNMLMEVAEDKRNRTESPKFSKRMVQLSVIGEEELAIIAVGAKVTDEQIKTAHEEYCTYREVCADAGEDQFDDFEHWAKATRPELVIERISLDQVIVNESVI